MKKRPNPEERGYDGEWRRYSKAYRTLNPWCVYCLKKGKRVKAEHVDHVTALRDNTALKFHPGNLRSLCARCHNRRTALDQRWASKEELRVDEFGWPVDPGHPWLKSERK